MTNARGEMGTLGIDLSSGLLVQWTSVDTSHLVDKSLAEGDFKRDDLQRLFSA